MNNTKVRAHSIVMVPVDELKPYARNPRQHSDAQVRAIMSSIRKFGFVAPLVIDDKRRLIAGHGRLRAAIMLRMKQVPCVPISGLSANEKRALILADNQLAAMSTWDTTLLAEEIQDIAQDGIDVSVLGFTEAELDNIERLGARAEEQDSGVRMLTCPKCGHQFTRSKTT